MTVMSPAKTEAGMILGTAAYMSPEQARGRVADRRADIWAFGAVLFEMLTGERLFAGETVTEVLAAVLKDPLRTRSAAARNSGVVAPAHQPMSRARSADAAARYRRGADCAVWRSDWRGKRADARARSARRGACPRASRDARRDRCIRGPRAGGHRGVRRLAREANGTDPSSAIRAAGGDGIGIGLCDLA